MPDRFQHPAHLPFAALVQRDLQHGAILAREEHPHLRGRGHPLLQSDPGAQPLQRLFTGNALDVRLINLRHPMPGMGEQLRQLPIIGDDQRPFRILIEPAHWMHRHVDIAQQIHHRAPGVGISAGGDVAAGLVEEYVRLASRDRHRASRDGDRVFLRVDLHAHLGDSLPIDGHLSRGDHPLRFTARSDAGGGQYFVQPFFHGVPLPRGQEDR